MSRERPIDIALDLVQGRAMEIHQTDDPIHTYVVWFCYILGGWKALLSTDEEDGRYYEVTYDKAKLSVYVDTYVKESNVSVAIPEAEEER